MEKHAAMAKKSPSGRLPAPVKATIMLHADFLLAAVILFFFRGSASLSLGTLAQSEQLCQNRLVQLVVVMSVRKLACSRLAFNSRSYDVHMDRYVFIFFSAWSVTRK